LVVNSASPDPRRLIAARGHHARTTGHYYRVHIVDHYLPAVGEGDE
jgi:hypothetical protein